MYGDCGVSVEGRVCDAIGDWMDACAWTSADCSGVIERDDVFMKYPACCPLRGALVACCPLMGAFIVGSLT